MKKLIAILLIAAAFNACNNPTEGEYRVSYEKVEVKPVAVDSIPVDSLNVDSVIWK